LLSIWLYKLIYNWLIVYAFLMRNLGLYPNDVFQIQVFLEITLLKSP
jgi:hypothetical protein